MPFASPSEHRIQDENHLSDVDNNSHFLGFTGWDSAQEWASIEGEFGISATCDNLGHVMFTITIKEFDGLEVWSSQVSLGLDAEQTEKIAKKWGNSLQTKTSKNF